MGSHSLPVDSDAANPDWHEIDDLLDELAELARRKLSAGEFYRQLLERIVPAIGVSGGAIWTAPRAGELRLECQCDLAGASAELDAVVLAGHQELVEDVLTSGQPRVAPLAERGLSLQVDADRGSSFAVLQPFDIGPQATGVIELVQRRPLTASEGHTYLQLLAAVVELTDDFHRHRELGELREREQSHGDYDRFALQVHRSLDVSQAAFLIANEGRRVIGCERLSVLISSGRSCRAAATSGVDVLDRRAKLVRSLEQLVVGCVASGEPLWYCDGSGDMPDEIERPLAAYLDESHARVLAIVPLFAEKSSDRDNGPARVIGALVAEQFQVSHSDSQLRDRMAAIAAHSGVVLSNALTHSRMPLARVGRMMARVRWLAEARQLPKTALVLVAIAAAAAALVFIPADFDIEARGELQPAVRRDVFASDNGVVSELLVEQGRGVQAGQPLITLRNPQLDLELRRLAGEMQTAEKKLAAVRAERLSNARTEDEGRRDVHQLTADEEELKELLEGLAKQREILKRQSDDLVIRSPIDGQALTWNLEELLAARPVERGQALLRVADLDGPWEVELRVPDDRTGHVLAAREARQPDLAVSFALASDPATEYRGRIARVALATEVDDVAGSTVLATVAFDRREVTGLRPGATVLAKIHCGRASLGYVWLHELFEFVQTHLWW